MSELTSVKTAVMRISSIFEDLKADTENQIPKLKKFNNNLTELVDKFEQERSANSKKIQTNADEIEALKTKKSQNARKIMNLNEESKNLSANSQSLGTQIETLTAEISNLENQIASKQSDLANREQRLHELETNVHQMALDQEKFDENLRKMSLELMEKYDARLMYANSFENRVKAMKLLIAKNYLKIPQVQLLKALQVGTELDLKNMVQAYDIKLDVATKILRKIVDLGGPVDFNETTGMVTLKEEVDFK